MVTTMELVYQRRLVHFLEQTEENRDGESVFVFTFRDGSGEKITFCMPQAQVPNTCFACNQAAFEQGLQEILDTQRAVYNSKD